MAVSRLALQETPIGRLVGKLRRRGGEVGDRASKLVSAWKARETKAATRLALRQVPRQSRYAITFGEVAILHVGGEEIGRGRRSEGFTVGDLEAIATRVNEISSSGGGGGEEEKAVPTQAAELVRISDRLPEALRTVDNDAATLVLRGGAALFGLDADALLVEQDNAVRYDTKYFDKKKAGGQGKTLNKRARHNVVFGEVDQDHSEDYRRCTVRSFAALPHLGGLRAALPRLLGAKALGLQAEGNHYFEAASGIGFHGDAERKVVVCVSLGAPSTLRYQWRLPGSSEHTLPPVDIALRHGDMYVMSEKATGFDWLSRSKVRVVHGAGASKFIDK